jgi:hypothetical protein
MTHTMKTAHIMPVLVAALLAAACGGDDGPTEVDNRASIRFVNATTGSGSGGFTANGQFVTGSAVGTGQATQTCSKVDPGTLIFGFGAANSGGTGLSGNPVVSSNNETIAAGGKYTVVATGSAANPSLFVFGNTLSSELTANQAGLRFANFAANTGTAVYNYVFYRGAIAGGASPLALNVPFGGISTFSIVPSGSTSFSVLQVPGHNIIFDGTISATLAGGSVNTMALVRNASGDLQLLHLPRCP